MVVGLLLLLFLALLQMCLWAYSRSLVASAATDAARRASAADAATFDPTRWVAERIGEGLGTGPKSTLRCTAGGSVTTVELHCTMQAPGLVGLAASDGIAGISQVQADDGTNKGLALHQIDLSVQ